MCFALRTQLLAFSLVLGCDAVSAAGCCCVRVPTCWGRRDWPGGQLTSSAVSAIDFGNENWKTANQPASLAAMVSLMPGNPGACWVSYKCFLPDWLVAAYIMPTLAALPNLRLFLRTTVRRLSLWRAPRGQLLHRLSVEMYRALRSCR